MDKNPISRQAIQTADAPPPAGAYSQAVKAGEFIFISGQTPRHPDGERAMELPFGQQAELVLNNLEAIAAAAGSNLSHAVHVTVFLCDMANAPEFNRQYESRIGLPAPARITVQSNLTTGDLEVTAILHATSEDAAGSGYTS